MVSPWFLLLLLLLSSTCKQKQKIVLKLLEHGANPLQRDVRGLTPVQVAQKKGYQRICVALREASFSHGQAQPVGPVGTMFASPAASPAAGDTSSPTSRSAASSGATYEVPLDPVNSASPSPQANTPDPPEPETSSQAQEPDIPGIVDSS